MNIVSYEITLRSNAGQPLAVIDDKTLLSLSLGRSIYGEGSLEITTTAAFPFSYIQQDGQLVVYRNIEILPTTSGYIPANLDLLQAPDGTVYQAEDGTDLWADDYTTGSPGVTTPGRVISQLLTDTAWLITYWDARIVNSSAPLYYIKAEPFVSLCKRRRVANAAGSPQASKTARGDDFMKAVMREQYGSLVTDSTRNISAYLAIEADVSAGVSMTKDFAREKVFTLLQAISQNQAQNGLRMYFDITFDPSLNMPTFRTYIGQRGADHSQSSQSPVVFSADRYNLANPALVNDYTNESNFVYALGQGVESERAEVTESDAARMGASVYNRREDVFDGRSYSAQAGLDDEAKAALYAGRPKIYISGTLLSTPDTTFGIHWGYGDLVTAEFGSVQQACINESIQISLSRGVESITGVARGIN